LPGQDGNLGEQSGLPHPGLAGDPGDLALTALSLFDTRCK
jgi:hypothetical protein